MKKKRKKKFKEDNTHYCTKCRKRTEHKGAGIKNVHYWESCTLCGTINYEECKRR
jgi:hypothetical protein